MKTVAVALSGGIDSALTAFLLREEGFQVLGLHADFGFTSERSRTGLETITSFLNIPLEVILFKDIFREQVVDYFIGEYARGRTPNPCVICNPRMKFDLLFEKGLTLGADFFATGHYARVVPAPWGEGWTIGRGVDHTKEQSYFLHRVKKENLNRILFPLGTWTKKQVKTKAGEIGLPVDPHSESQDICFFPAGGYRDFLLDQGPPGLTTPGDIVDLQGRRLGVHQGLFAYTIGQRRGMGIPAAEPFYVIRMETDTNRLVIGGKKDLLAEKCLLSDFYFLCRPGQIKGLEVEVQIRYRHKPAKAILKQKEDGRIEVKFDSPQPAVTPGQAGVVYWGSQVLGGGWIEAANVL